MIAAFAISCMQVRKLPNWFAVRAMERMLHSNQTTSWKLWPALQERSRPCKELCQQRSLSYFSKLQSKSDRKQRPTRREACGMGHGVRIKFDTSSFLNDDVNDIQPFVNVDFGCKFIVNPLQHSKRNAKRLFEGCTCLCGSNGFGVPYSL